MQFSDAIQLKDGKFLRLDLHERRVNETRAKYFFASPQISLTEVLIDFPAAGLYKCRVLYGEEIESVEFLPYSPKIVKTAKLVSDDEIDYSSKFADRSRLNRLFEMRGNADDVLIIKGGFVTDFSAANILLFDGSKWVTPDTPLLRGTHRRFLLERGLIREAAVRAEDLPKYSKIIRLSAMVDFESATREDGITIIV